MSVAASRSTLACTVSADSSTRISLRSSCSCGSHTTATSVLQKVELVTEGAECQEVELFTDRFRCAHMHTCNCAKVAALLMSRARMPAASNSRAATSGCLFVAFVRCEAALLLL